jgi:hypothetical protein
MGFVDEANEALNLPPVEAEKVEGEVVPYNDKDDDYQFARANIKSAIEDAQQALGELVDVADQSQSPRAYEVLSTMLKNVVDANKTLIDIQKTNEEVKQVRRDGNAPKTQTNNLVLSTTELQKMLKGE